MKKILTSALVAVFTLVGCTQHKAPLTAPPAPTPFSENSVQPIQFMGQTFCTAFSINEAAGTWATAQHCIVAADKREWTMSIEGKEVITIAVDIFHDIAILQGDVHEKALQLSSRAPLISVDEIEIKGFPYGLPRLVTTKGTLGARNVPVGHPLFERTLPSDLYDITVAGGNSGSPVLMGKRLVGILWGGFTESRHAVVVPYDEVKRFLPQYMN